MPDQPPVQPPVQPPHEPSGQPAEGNPATRPSAAGAAAATPMPVPPGTNVWHQATSTRGGRWAIAIAAGALGALMLLGIGVAGALVLHGHDRFNPFGQRRDGFSPHEDGRGDGRGNGPGAGRGENHRQPGMPGQRDGRPDGLRGLGGLLGGTALHGSVTATVNGSAQALVFQRGTVTAVSATSITLKSTDGFVGTYGRTAATTTRRAAPVTGAEAFVVARASDKAATAVIAARAGVGVGPTS
jgi:hypothetical protein